MSMYDLFKSNMYQGYSRNPHMDWFKFYRDHRYLKFDKIKEYSRCPNMDLFKFLYASRVFKMSK